MNSKIPPSRLVVAATLSLLCAPALNPFALARQNNAAPPAPRPDNDAVITIKNGVAVGGVARGGRVPFAPDAVQNLLVRGAFNAPRAGDTVLLPDGKTTRTWQAITADADGWFTGAALTGGGYLYATIDAPVARVCLLEATGDGMVYVNNEPRAGDPYSYGSLRLPVQLRKGANTFLFTAGRGRLRARLLPAIAPLQWNRDDTTLPDLRTGETRLVWASVPLLNTTNRTLTDLRVRARIAGGETVETVLPPVPPMTVRKVGFRLKPPALLTGETMTAQVTVSSGDKSVGGAQTAIALRVRKTGDTFKETFQSQIDDSVQYFAVNPARKPSPQNAFVLSLHGASVEATGQADAYSPKDDVTLIAPTNRRPFGFDWEDWGRLDALEVFALAQKEFPHDPARVSLTGHSMGGHGTWSLGSLFPDRFAVIGPSAGWISFATYAGGAVAPPVADAVTSLVNRAASQHDTLAWATNLLQERIYIVHGDADDNVPVTEARQMRARLAEMGHPAVEWHEEPGAGHWWDDSKTPGAECVDWKPMWARFETERLKPNEWNAVDFTTVNPAISGVNRWVRVEQQERSLLPSRVRLAWDAQGGSITGTTQNVAALTIAGARLPGVGNGGALRFVVLDDQRVSLGETTAPGERTLRRVGGKWRVAAPIAPDEKTPERGGPFKQAFQNRFVLVYATGGTEDENRASYARARFDAESFLYRGNASPDILADRDYQTRAGMSDRSVILYGNSDTNRAWGGLLRSSPVQVRRGAVRVGERTVRGDNLACVFLRPKPGSRVALVGVVAATGPEGARLTERLSYFTSGAAFPDWVVFGPNVLVNPRKGVVAAGYFGNNWGVETGESAWRAAAPVVAPQTEHRQKSLRLYHPAITSRRTDKRAAHKKRVRVI